MESQRLYLKDSMQYVPTIWDLLKEGPLKVAVIGSGNWGSVAARIIGQNTANNHLFQPTVHMYVWEEIYKGRKLTEIINTTHCNEKYLPGITLPSNVVAEPDVRKCVKDAHLIVFVVPHQFIQNICRQLQGHIHPNAKAISLIKGFDCANNKINLMSEYIRSTLDIDVCSLSGANVAEPIGLEQFSETTIGYKNEENAHIFKQLFERPYFRVNLVRDVESVEICGSLKNIVALGAGFIDGLGYGSNTKAAIIRLGFLETRKFVKTFYPDSIDDAFWDSAGIADLLTTCYGGRNRKCAEEFVKSGKSWSELERTMLNGQKLQGTHTARDVFTFLRAQGKEKEFPLFTTIYEIVDLGAPPINIILTFMKQKPKHQSKL